MPRPRNIIRTVPLKVWIEEPLMARIYALAYSELEGRIPYKSLATFFSNAARHYLEHLEKEQQNAVQTGQG